jgi:hypothetical protein
MTSVLQFFLAVSAHKSQVLLYRLDVNLLGKPSIPKDRVSVKKLLVCLCVVLFS